MSKKSKDDVTVTFTPASPGAETEGLSIVQFDAEGQFKEAHCFGNFAEKIDGGVRVFRPDGTTITMKDGSITIENLVPKLVGIRNLSEIESCAVKTVGQTRICRMDFFGGGHFEVVYSHDGKVIEYSGQNIYQTLTNDNEVIVSRSDFDSGQAN